jgi:ligand-binding SRPBCC domain-containing protein
VTTFERSTTVRAPIERVWEFHSTVDGLVELTPGWMNLRVEAVRGPDGGPDPEVLTVGSTVELSTRPFGVGPRQSWTSEIVERREREDAARFRDVMHDGPFERWEHTHTFVADGEATRVRDRVEYRLPVGAASPLALVGLEPMFAYRHHRTRRLLER